MIFLLAALAEMVGNSGCYIESRNRLLVVENRLSGGLLTPPGGTAERGESAQATAARETYEESGVAVEVGELLHRFPNGFYLFRCSLKDRAVELLESLPVPPPFRGEITRAYWLDLRLSRPEAWRFPDQFLKIREIFLSRFKSGGLGRGGPQPPRRGEAEVRGNPQAPPK